jgi:hypothetical protein
MSWSLGPENRKDLQILNKKSPEGEVQHNKRVISCRHVGMMNVARNTYDNPKQTEKRCHSLLSVLIHPSDLGFPWRGLHIAQTIVIFKLCIWHICLRPYTQLCWSQWPRGLGTLEHWYSGFESHSRHGCLCVGSGLAGRRPTNCV